MYIVVYLLSDNIVIFLAQESKILPFFDKVEFYRESEENRVG